MIWKEEEKKKKLSLFIMIYLILFRLPSGYESNESEFDPYATLGLKKFASQNDINRSYKRYINYRKTHLNPSEKMLKQWNDIEKAYGILKTNVGRSIYDQIGNEGFESETFKIVGYKSDEEVISLGYFDANRANQASKFGGIITYPIYLELKDFMTGKKKNFHIFRSVPCVCAQKGTNCKKCKQSPIISQYEHYTLYVPKGTRPSSRLFASNITDSDKHRSATDVIFIAYVKPNNNFTLVGHDLYSNVTIPLAQSFTKNTINFRNLDGQNVPVSFQNVRDGDTIVVSGKGFPYQNDPKKRGDLILTVKLQFPKNLSNEQKEKIKKILPDDISNYQ